VSMKIRKEESVSIEDVNHWVKVALKHGHQYPVIILHGGPGGYNYVFEREPGPLLEESLDIIYYEQRGCGRSEKPFDNDYSVERLVQDLYCLLKHLNLQKVVLLGYSFGAELATEFAIKYPNHVHKLILQAPTDFSQMDNMFEIQYRGFKDLGANFIFSNASNILTKYDQMWASVNEELVNKFLFFNQERGTAMRVLWQASGLINTGEMSQQVFNRRRQTPLLEDIKHINAPTLILIGKHDKNVGVELARNFHDNIENSEFHIFENSGHFPDFEEPERYVEVVKRFILND